MVVSTSGDLGDVVYLLGILKELGGGPHSLLLEPSNLTKFKTWNDIMRLHRFMSDLVLSQDYIKEFRPVDVHDKVDWVSGNFRSNGWGKLGDTLMHRHLRHLIDHKGVAKELVNVVGESKWINAESAWLSPVIINRTHRYHSRFFDWKPIVKHYGNRLAFIGTEIEWRDFCLENGIVEFIKTDTALEVAQIIAGSDLFIGNQSMAYAIAEGMKHNTLQETSSKTPDCVFFRPNAQYAPSGRYTLPDIEGSGALEVEPPKPPALQFNTQTGPPHGWMYKGRFLGNGFGGAMSKMMLMPEFQGGDRTLAEEALIGDNVDRCPEFFMKQHPDLSAGFRIAEKYAMYRAKLNRTSHEQTQDRSSRQPV